MCEGNSDYTRAGADVANVGLLQMMMFGELSAKVNEQFSFGSWNEYASVYLEVTAVELFFA